MRKVIGAVLLLILCLMSWAAAEPELIPQLPLWEAEAPVDALICADVRTHMPFDDVRCAQLNGLLSHLSLHLQTGGMVSRAALLVDGRAAIWLAQRNTENGAQTQVSWADGTFACDMNSLLGGEESISLESPYMTWLEDGVTFVEALAGKLDAYKKETAVKTSIKNMGVARTKITYTIPKTEVEVFATAVKESGQQDLSFAGQQKLLLWRSEDGDILRAEYSGQCGKDADSLRKVSLVWRLCREDDCIRDDVTLKTPAVTGSDYNTLTCTRHVQKDDAGAVRYELKYSYTAKKDGAKSTWAGDIDLTGTPENGATRLTGSGEVSSKAADADAETSTVLTPNLLIGEADGAPVVSGVLTVQEKRAGRVVEDADVTITMEAGMPLLWTETEVLPMTEERRSSLAADMSAALVKRLVLLPKEDTLYLSADLPDDTWQRIVDAAQAALEEETP